MHAESAETCKTLDLMTALYLYIESDQSDTYRHTTIVLYDTQLCIKYDTGQSYIERGVAFSL